MIDFRASEVNSFIQDIDPSHNYTQTIEAQHVPSTIFQKNQQTPRSFLVIGKRDALLTNNKQVFVIPIR